MATVQYLEHDEVLIIHARIIDETGGAHGVRDIHLVASMMERPKMRFGGTLKVSNYEGHVKLGEKIKEIQGNYSSSISPRYLHSETFRVEK